MANILDYLDWRGDVPFSVSPLNEVDNLIFSELCFINFTDIVPADIEEQGVPLSLACQLYCRMHEDEQTSMGLIVPADIPVLMKKMAETSRFGNVVLRGYVDRTEEEMQKQFAALTFDIDGKELYVAYRGTDDTLVGWKENFNMSFMHAIPAQLDAVEYLNRVAAHMPHETITVGGHSKGGNLSVYASIHCEEQYKPRIARVYSNDGPGYRRGVIESEAYQGMQDRIVSIIPQSSVVGRLLEHNDDFRVVQSSASGLWQHDGFSWEVVGTTFVSAPKLTADSERTERAIKQWVAEMDETQQEKLVDSLYSVLTATNAKTLTDLTRDRNWLWRLMTDSELSESRKTLLAGLRQLTGEAGRVWIDSVLPAKLKKTPEANAAKQEEKPTEPPAQKPSRPLIETKAEKKPTAGTPTLAKTEAKAVMARCHRTIRRSVKAAAVKIKGKCPTVKVTVKVKRSKIDPRNIRPSQYPHERKNGK